MSRIELLGGFRVLTHGSAATRPPGARQQELIAFLLLHARGAPVQRQRVAGSLWPESSDAQALTNLRRELHHLRDAWPRLDALIDAGPRTLAWSGAAGVKFLPPLPRTGHGGGPATTGAAVRISSAGA